MRPLAEIRVELRALDRRRRAVRAELLAAEAIPGARATKWKGAALEALKTDYETTVRKLRELALSHNTSAGCVVNLAAAHGWQRRAIYQRDRLHEIAARHGGVPTP